MEVVSIGWEDGTCRMSNVWELLAAAEASIARTQWCYCRRADAGTGEEQRRDLPAGKQHGPKRHENGLLLFVVRSSVLVAQQFESCLNAGLQQSCAKEVMSFGCSGCSS